MSKEWQTSTEHLPTHPPLHQNSALKAVTNEILADPEYFVVMYSKPAASKVS